MDHKSEDIINMNKVLFQKGQKIHSPDGTGEVIEIIRDKIIVLLDKGMTKLFSFDAVREDHTINNAHNIIDWPPELHYRAS